MTDAFTTTDEALTEQIARALATEEGYETATGRRSVTPI